MKTTGLVILLIGVMTIAGTAQMTFVEDSGRGTLTLRDGRLEVLTFRFGDQLKEGVDPKYIRSGYIHPLFSLDGRMLTDDFPKDHFHHHGLFWTWPVVRTRGQTTQTWHPASPSLRQHFVRWLKREARGDAAELSVESVWKLDGREIVASEIVKLDIQPADNISRTIDIELRLEAVGGPLELQGTPDQNKGYGGLCLRGAEMFTGATLATEQGVQKEDAVNTSFRWADLSNRELGVSIFVSPDHPGFPVAWLIRTSYGGVLNPSWPGLKPAILQPGKPIVLRYRLYIHRGDAASGGVQEAYRRYIK